MSATTITQEFAIQELKRMKLPYWDLYTSEGSGIVLCQQTEMPMDDSAEILRNSFAQLNGDKILIKASKFTREEKGKNPKLNGGKANEFVCWIKLNGDGKVNSSDPSPTVLSLMQKVYDLQLEMKMNELKRQYEESDKVTTADSIAHTILTDPFYKTAIINGLNKLAGSPTRISEASVRQAAESGSDESVTGNAADYLKSKGHDAETIIDAVAAYEKKNPGSTDIFLTQLKSMGVI